MALATLQRTHFSTDRALEFFTELELRTQMGCGRGLWALALAKELIDNSLDGCESVPGCIPEIVVTLEPDSLSVADNGPGLQHDVIERSLNYNIRVSDKKHYVAPTRGQLGNALKCVWAVPFVVSGERGLIEVESHGTRHCIRVELDRLAQKPRIVDDRTADSMVQIGTSIKIHWPKLAKLRIR